MTTRRPGEPRRRGPSALLGATLLAAGCSVSPPAVLDEGFFACASAEDCGPGQACAEGNVYAPDFCRPACDPDDPETCPHGVCTAAGACLERCTIDPDGTAVGCPGEDFDCVRIDAIRHEGVCFPVQSCSRSADCASDGDVPQLCLNDALGLPSTTIDDVRFDNLYCTARPDEEGFCPTGYLSYRFANADGSSTRVCYPPCDPGGGRPWCPPATTCFRGFGEIAGTPDMPPCLPGVWGLPCADDTQCLIGRCLPVGGGARACTETCADADTLAGGCSGLERFGEAFGSAARMACEDVDGVETCVPRYDLLSLCDEQLECVGADTTCSQVRVSEDTLAHVCLRACRDAQDCAAGTGGVATDYRCIQAGDRSVCMRKRALGARCVDDLDCREGRCCDVDGLRACLRECP
ncbi:MAG TPA: hypothetical protein RMH99_07170 [Sandaracinaceae bacterium LLY-WYZ-13_1]|nr:hypothetical protein [Sandaracinaceae bacterium LLY-WYZ-13_1]